MVMSVVESHAVSASQYPELQGARVLITGLESGHGVDIARAFAEQGCRLVLQTPELDTALEILLETLVRDAADVHVSDTALDSEDAALRFAQSAAGVFGGLDAVVNLARLDDDGLTVHATAGDIETRLSRTLSGPLLITRVIANRMQLTWREGLILNIVTQKAVDTPAAAQLGRIARAALAALTRREAQRWADKAVRVNAIVPAGENGLETDSPESGLTSEPQIAELALRLASTKGKSLSGLVFDAEPGRA
jgi:NAD(P)-dependent dehydrogenase (short-subunit alcohol dehydrogenase family)